MPASSGWGASIKTVPGNLRSKLLGVLAQPKLHSGGTGAAAGTSGWDDRESGVEAKVSGVEARESGVEAKESGVEDKESGVEA
jgi:hypothetical protein